MSKELHKKLRGPRVGNRKRRFLTYTEIQKVFEFLQQLSAESRFARTEQDRFYVAYVLGQFLFTHGLRISEALSLQWNDIKWYGEHCIAYFIGKGGVEAEQKILSSSLEVVREMNRRIRRREPVEDDYLFPAPEPRCNVRSKGVGRRMTPEDALVLFREAQNEVNKTHLLEWTLSNLSTHHFRHSLGQYLSREKKLPVQTIAKVLRHKDVNITAQTYCEPEAYAPEDYL